MKTKEEIDAILLGLHQSGNYPAYDANLLADVLMDEFQKMAGHAGKYLSSAFRCCRVLKATSF